MWWLVVLLAIGASGCVRRPDEAQSLAYRSPGDAGFHIQVNGAPEHYTPGSSYVVSIVGARNGKGQRNTFRGFQLTAERNGRAASPQHVGSFILYPDQSTQYHEECVNTVRETDNKPRSEVQVMWAAPSRATGCITFKALVLVDEDTWYADDGGLSYQICDAALRNSEPPPLECCACSQAKYKMIFEGLWSAKTHPKDFPTNVHFTHFSDVVGASHRTNFSFWSEGEISSDGMRQLAEWGSARGLEAELKSQAKNLRTLIKAPGLWYPHVNENTTAQFRTDKTRPLLSVASMFGPSPDWIVGVTGLNLCTAECGWIDNKIIDLYPYDAGTDSGVTYNSPNEPTNPRERIHRITTKYPEDPRAPFYDMAGRMEPLARLFIILESTKPQPCNIEDRAVDLPATNELAEFTEDTKRPECNVTDYTAFSPCSASCGKGFRMRTRTYVMPMKAQMLGCERQLVSKEMCVAAQPLCPGDQVQHPAGLITEHHTPEESSEEIIEDTSEVCKTTEYGPWSECSVTCGVGVAMRTRRFKDQWGRKKCPHVSLVEKRECVETPCPPMSPGINMDQRCTVSEWSDFSPCSATCGTGLRFRSRQLLVSGELKDICQGKVELQQQRICTLQADCRADNLESKEICMAEPDNGPCRGYFERWYFDPRERTCVRFPYGGCRGNKNNFRTKQECKNKCESVSNDLAFADDLKRGEATDQKVDCEVTSWQPWSPCSVSCGQGVTVRYRRILRQPRNGGKVCPTHLVRKRTCSEQPCPTNDQLA